MRHTSLVRRAAAASIAVLALTAVAACSDDPETDDVASETESSTPSEPTEPSDTAPAEGEEVDPAAFISDVLGGLADASTAHLTMEMKGGPVVMSAEGDIDYSTSPPSMSMTMTNRVLGDGTIEMRLVDGAMYMKLAQLGDKWVKYDLDGEGSPLGDDFTDQLNPGTGLEIVEDSVTSVTYVGEEDVDGETLRHYTMKVRPEAARELQEELGGVSGADVPSIVEFEVWVDDEDLLRQSRVSMGKVGSITTTISGWGEPVDISAPPAADVMQLPGSRDS